MIEVRENLGEGVNMSDDVQKNEGHLATVAPSRGPKSKSLVLPSMVEGGDLDWSEAEEEIRRREKTLEQDRKNGTDARETLAELRSILKQPVPR